MEDTVGQHRLRPAPGRESSGGDASRSARGALIDRIFGKDDITVLRHEVTQQLGRTVPGDRLDGFVLAVNEIITNVVLHAGGGGRLVLAVSDGAVRCTITDSGTGIPAEFQHPPEVPAAFGLGGRGIWLAHRLCDEVTMATGPIGTTIGLKIDLSAGRNASDLVNGSSSNA